MKSTLFITGTGTGVGKTVLTALLAEFLRRRGLRVAALKPICSGGRDDAHILHTALGGTLPLDQINPWYFRAAIAPLLAARRERRRVTLAPVLAHIRAHRRRFDAVLIEGAGGLLSPLGVGFDSRKLITALDATPIIVASSQLGVVNQVLLTLEALPAGRRRRARVALMAPPSPEATASSNARLLRELTGRPIRQLPWFGQDFTPGKVLAEPRVNRTLAALMG